MEGSGGGGTFYGILHLGMFLNIYLLRSAWAGRAI